MNWQVSPYFFSKYPISPTVTCATWLFGGGHTPIREFSHPTNEHECLTHADSNMMPLWFDVDCMQKVLIDNDDLSN